MRFSAFILIAAFMAMLGLAGCGGQAVTNTSYVLPDTPGGRLCSTQCREARGYCQQDCDISNRKCVGVAQSRALQDYDKYTREQFMNHESIELRPRDFERFGLCDDAKKSCTDDCENHFQSCYEKCGGKVITTSSCQFMCF